MRETKVRILDCFTVQDSYGEKVLAKVLGRGPSVRFGDDTGTREGRYVVYWTDAPSERPFRWPLYWFYTLAEARECFESERDYEMMRRR